MQNISFTTIITFYLLIINIFTFFLYGVDKWKAQRARWRIPESVLLGVAAIGGSVGAWLGMRVWRHKTQHAKFRYGVPIILIAQVALLVWIFLYRNSVKYSFLPSLLSKKIVSLQLIIF